MYKQIKDSFGNLISDVIKRGDGAFIPFDPANTDYQTYLKWLDGYEMIGGQWQKTSDSNTPQSAD